MHRALYHVHHLVIVGGMSCHCAIIDECQVEERNARELLKGREIRTWGGTTNPLRIGHLQHRPTGITHNQSHHHVIEQVTKWITRSGASRCAARGIQATDKEMGVGEGILEQAPKVI